MSTTPLLRLVAALLLCALAIPCPARAQAGTAFSFQGRLYDSGIEASGTVSLRITPWDADTAGTALAAPLETGPLALTDGVFDTVLDFGPAVFLGTPVWLAIEADTGAGYVLLEPRQPVTPTPYAMHAQSVAVDSVDGFALQDGAVGAAKIAPGAVGATQVDATQVQRRIGPPCAAGSALADVAQDGATSCVPLPEDPGWNANESFIWTTKKLTVGMAGYRGAKVLVAGDSSVTAPQLELYEQQIDFARLTLSNIGVPAGGGDTHYGFWSIAARTLPEVDGGPALDRINFYNNRVGDVMSLLGNGRLGIGSGATNPDAPLMLASRGYYAPGVGGGRGDFHIGNTSLGLSFGVATGGGGAGASRIWTDGGFVNQLFLGSATHGDVLAINEDRVGIGLTDPQAALDVDGGARIRGLADGAAVANRPVEVLADGTLVAGVAPAASHELVIDAVALTPDTDAAAYSKRGFDFSGAYGLSGSFVLFAPVSLPTGARITGFSCRLKDNSSVSGADVYCSLGSRDSFGPSAPSWSARASVNTSGASSAWQTLTDTTINGQLVDAGDAFFVSVSCSAWQGTNTAVTGIRITYTQ